VFLSLSDILPYLALVLLCEVAVALNHAPPASVLVCALAATLYAIAGAYFWRSAWQPAESQDKQEKYRGEVWVLTGLAVHGAVLYRSLFLSPELNLSLWIAISVIMWLTVLIYGLASCYYSIRGLQALILPAAAVCVLLPAMFPAQHMLSYSELPVFKLHLLIAFSAYGLFTVAAFHALLMAYAERQLHGRNVPAVVQNLPPLLTMEALLFKILTLAFVLLTLTVASGVLFSEALFHKPLQFNHKTVFSLLAWFIFAALLGGRKIRGWRGRTAIRWTLIGFSALLLAYLGSKFVLEVILQR
jgi:ABC-type uncharacterized transport system permease subunit